MIKVNTAKMETARIEHGTDINVGGDNVLVKQRARVFDVGRGLSYRLWQNRSIMGEPQGMRGGRMVLPLIIDRNCVWDPFI